METIKRGDIFLLGNHVLMCGDATTLDDVQQIIPPGLKVDMIYTDPPYGISERTDRATYKSGPSRMTTSQSFDKIIGDESIETARNGFTTAQVKSDIICYWGGHLYGLPPTRCWVVWDKRCDDKQRDSNSDCELAYVVHPKKKSIRIFRHLWKGMIKASERGERRVHPTQKPVALAQWCIEELNPGGSTVLDLFGGSGSTLIACEKMGRKCFMLELDENYCRVIITRWELMTGHKAQRLNINMPSLA